MASIRVNPIITVRLAKQLPMAFANEVHRARWDLEDPKGKSMEKVREIRDKIEQKVLALIAETKNWCVDEFEEICFLDSDDFV